MVVFRSDGGGFQKWWYTRRQWLWEFRGRRAARAAPMWERIPSLRTSLRAKDTHCPTVPLRPSQRRFFRFYLDKYKIGKMLTVNRLWAFPLLSLLPIYTPSRIKDVVNETCKRKQRLMKEMQVTYKYT